MPQTDDSSEIILRRWPSRALLVYVTRVTVFLWIGCHVFMGMASGALGQGLDSALSASPLLVVVGGRARRRTVEYDPGRLSR